MSVAKGHRYEVGGVRRQSPYLQELCVYFGQFTCYASAEALLAKTLRIDVSDSSIFRLTNQVGEGCEVVADQACLSQAQGRVVYAMADGSMVLTRQDGWREVKVGRIFADCHHGPVSEGRSAIARSLYVAHLGGHQHFEARWAELLDPFEGRAAQMVFISDGALWIRDFVSAHYPSAVQILDGSGHPVLPCQGTPRRVCQTGLRRQPGVFGVGRAHGRLAAGERVEGGH